MARRGAKRKSKGYTPGHKPVNDDNRQVNFLGTPELMLKRAELVGVTLANVGGKYEARWTEDGKAANLLLHTEDRQIACQRLGLVPRVRAHDGTHLHALILRGEVDAKYHDVARKVQSVITKFQSALKMIGGPELPRAGGGNFIGEMPPVYARNDWDCQDFLDMKSEYESLLGIMNRDERVALRAIQWGHVLSDVDVVVSALQKAGDFFGMLGRGR